jgi:hypothetical protein
MDKDCPALVDSVINPSADVVEIILDLLVWGILHLNNFVLELVSELRVDTAHSLDNMGYTSRFQSFKVLRSSNITNEKIRDNSI